MMDLDIAKLAEAMDWVIPPDASPGAGSEMCVRRMLELIGSLPPDVADLYLTNLPDLVEADLADAANSFAQLLIEQVRDVYYAYPESGSWADIGFKVTDP
jgi:hypothetical protein